MTKEGIRLATDQYYFNNEPAADKFDLNETLRTLVHSRQGECRRQDIAMILDLAPELPQAATDVAQLENVLFALLENTEKAIVGNGDSHGTIIIRTRSNADKIQLSISYAGTADAMRRAFESLQAACAICAQIVQDQGGELYVWRPRQSGWTTTVVDVNRLT